MLPTNLLYQELSKKIEGIAVTVRTQYGSGQKEGLYQRAFEDELKFLKISYKRECPIVIYSFRTGRVLGKYVPDFIINDKLLDYLKNSKYELGYIINFSGGSLYKRRFIWTNDRKDFNQIVK